MAVSSRNNLISFTKPGSCYPIINTTFKPNSKTMRALFALAISIVLPLSLTMTITLLFGSGQNFNALAKPFWFPPLRLIHLASLSSSFLMGLASWLVWANDGLKMDTYALPLYVAQVSLSIVWVPLVLVMGAALPACVFCLVHFGTLCLCCVRFGEVNVFARDLVKPCLGWVAYLTFVSFQLLYI